ncbi:hypothetical protein Ahia01_000599000 [Argonauta hians]
MSVPFSNTKLRVPIGFEALLEGFAREVLRAQPNNIIQFGAMYFTNLLKIRKDTGHDPVAVSASLIDRQYNSDYFTGPTESAPQEEEMPDLKDPELEQAAIKIQASFKGYKTRKELGMKTTAATKIQAGIRGHLTRKKIRTMKDEMSRQHHHHHHHHHRHTHQLHHRHANPESPQPQDENVLLHDPNIHYAATKIQAQFRGFRARQQMKVLKVKANAEKTMPPVDPDDPRAHEAATKIQAMIRGRKARKEMKVLKLQNKHGHSRHRGHTGSHGKPSKSHYKDMSRDQSPDQAEQDTSPIPPNGEPVPNKESSVDKEEVDIDLKDPDVEAAALKIQSSFRSLQKKKTVESVEGSIDGTDAEHKANVTKEENTKELTQAVETPPTAAPVDGETNKESVSGNTELETAQSQKNDNKEDSDDTKDKDKVSAKPEEGNSKEVPSAETADETAVQTPATTTADPTGVTPAETEEVDIDLEDPDVAAAALKIQANFRGNLMRKKKKGFGANKNMENQE